MDDDSLDFCDDIQTVATMVAPPWKVLIVDDDPGVHAVTNLVMHGFCFENRPIQLWHCYSGIEAKELLDEHADFALIFLDVVMESEEAGLEVVTYLRGTLNNHLTRIVLRTGQSGRSPEEHVIRQYDINDYKEKSDLTERKLKTVFFSSLRNYRDLCQLENARVQLKLTIQAIAQLHQAENLSSFAVSFQEQLKHLLASDQLLSDVHLLDAYAVTTDEDTVKVMAIAAGQQHTYAKAANWKLPPSVKAQIDQAFFEKCSRLNERSFLGFTKAVGGSESVLHLAFDNPVNTHNQEYLSLFVENALITYRSLLLDEELNNTQRSTVLLLCEAVEQRTQELGEHVKRVSELSAIMARELGMSAREIERIRQASPLHDVGKIGISDAILTKPGKYDSHEWELIKTHAAIGKEVLSKFTSNTLSLAAIIAYEHHEHWDGKGYPRGLKAEQIHIAGRIVAVADVMDALVNKRCYREAWSFSKAFDYLASQREKQFDPQIIDLFLSCQPEILALYERHRD